MLKFKLVCIGQNCLFLYPFWFGMTIEFLIQILVKFIVIPINLNANIPEHVIVLLFQSRRMHSIWAISSAGHLVVI